MNIAMDMNFFDTLLLIIYTNIVHAHACFENKLRQGLYSRAEDFTLLSAFYINYG
jgi:hypothetical protein